MNYFQFSDCSLLYLVEGSKDEKQSKLKFSKYKAWTKKADTSQYGNNHKKLHGLD